jgi:hypothetical protein
MSVQEVILSAICIVLAAALTALVTAQRRGRKFADESRRQKVDRLQQEVQSLQKQLLSQGQDHAAGADANQQQVDRLRQEILGLQGKLMSQGQILAAETESKQRLHLLDVQVSEKIAELELLKKELDLVDAAIELKDSAFVRREFTYEDPVSYQLAIESCEEQMAGLIKADLATKCLKSWEFDGSVKRGEAMIKKLRRLALRTFNADADAAIGNVRWNNYAAMESRIKKSEETIEKTLEQWGIIVSDDYRDLKIKELRLTYEQVELKKRIRDEQQALREQQREEERVRREAETAERDAAREEKRALLALQKAREELSESHVSDISRHQERIRELEAQVAEAEQKRQRALSMAEQTRRGHVYIASNIGSFGDSVLKIGMTRRLDPMDRIWELSDASVPFDFDVHGLIATEDAPALEAQLHERFAIHRVNLVNLRKEFFEVSITDLQKVVSELGFDVRLTLAAEAREVHESLAIRRSKSPNGLDVGAS